MQKLTICKGLPASGKTTFAKAWVFEDPKTRIRVNRDDIRRMLGPYWIPSREGLVTTIEHNMIRDGLINNYDVILDATNLGATTENYSNMLRAWGIPYHKIEIVDFTNISLEECIARDAFRDKSEQVGESVILGMYNKYLKKN